MKTTTPTNLHKGLILAASFAILAVNISRAQQVPAPAEQPLSPNSKPIPVVAENATTAPRSEEVVEMSPFEVVSSSKGYYSQNSMSGTRFNTKVEDLAVSMTVMTTQQMTDFAMTDINDIMLYTASGEGTGTYSDITIDRNGSVTDNVQMSPNTANRMRGLSSANISYGNYELQSNRYTIDPIDTEGVEISRGPNASVFGLGQPGGTVNIVPVSANLTRRKASVSIRVDNLAGYRTSFDFNQVLKKNVLAIRVNGAIQDEQFVRKPSGVLTHRYNALIKYRPFKTTTISAGYKYYKMDGIRPNFSPPNDSMTSWIEAGKPSWDPVAQKITMSDGTVWGQYNASGSLVGPNGKRVGPGGTFPIVADSVSVSGVSYAVLPDFFRSGIATSNPNLFIDQGAVQYWTLNRVTSRANPNAAATTAMSPAPNNTIRLLTTTPSGISGGRSTTQPLFTGSPVVDDQSIYDWTEINLAAMNRTWDKTQMYSVTLDQEIFKTKNQMMFAQLGFLREDDERWLYRPFSPSSLGQTGQLFVDANIKNIDGTPNPYYGRPYIGILAPEAYSSPSTWDTYRGQASYQLDLTQQKGFVKWLGRHQVSGYYEYKLRINRRYGYKDAISSQNPWFKALPAGTTLANQSNVAGTSDLASPNATRSLNRYYVGDASGNNIDYSPTSYQYGTYNYIYGNMTQGFVYEPTSIGLVGTSDGTGGNANSRTTLKTYGVVIQSSFWDGRITTIFGAREDKQYVKRGNRVRYMQPDLIHVDVPSADAWAPETAYNSGHTTNVQVVARPLRNTIPFLQRAAREGGAWGAVSQAVQSLAYTYNKSNSFVPADPRVDINLKPLVNPHGTSTDHGLWMSIGDKLSVRYVRFDTLAIDERRGDAPTLAQRATRIDVAPFATTSAGFLLRKVARLSVAASEPGLNAQQIENRVAELMGMSNERMDALGQAFDGGLLSATQDTQSKGQELEVNFNPTPYWTVFASVTDTRVINSNVSKDTENFINERMPIWTTFVDKSIPGAPVLWWKTRYGSDSTQASASATQQTPEQNYISFIKTPQSVLRQLEGKPNPQLKRYTAKVSTSFNLAGITTQKILKGFTVGGALRWEDKSAIGYLGVMNDPTQPGIYTDLDVDQPVFNPARYYFDAFIRYRTKMLYNKVGVTLQANVRNMTENGSLQPISVNPDGTNAAYRIVDPRTISFTATFDF